MRLPKWLGFAMFAFTGSAVLGLAFAALVYDTLCDCKDRGTVCIKEGA